MRLFLQFFLLQSLWAFDGFFYGSRTEPDDWCKVVRDCNKNERQRLDEVESQVAAHQVAISNLQAKNDDLERENDRQQNEINQLKSDVHDLEEVALPGKIPASCQEYDDRGEYRNGNYYIRPSTAVEPFSVYCDFN